MKSKKIQNWAFLFAMVLFIYGLWKSISQKPEIFQNIDYYYLPILIILVPLSFSVMAIRFKLSAEVIDSNFTFWQSMKVIVLSGAANMLPVPGGIMVRVAAMAKGGSTIKKSIGVNLELMIGWIGICLLYFSISSIYSQQWMLGIIAVLSSVCIILFSGWLIHKRTNRILMDLKFLMIQLAATFIDLFRIFICFRILGDSVELFRVLGLSLASVAGSVISIVPAGLGIREWVSSLLALLFDIAPENAYLASTLNRIVALCIVLILAGIILRLQNSEQQEAET